MHEAIETSVPSDRTPVLIVVDWGTTNLRAMLVSPSGDVIASDTSKEGLLSAKENFGQILTDRIGHWLDQFDNLSVIMSGMIGSRTGWIEVPYIMCPISASALANGLTRVDDFNRGRCWIVPGVRGTSLNGEADVMRGEEVQIVGAIDLFAKGGTELPEVICLPGTHNKWVVLSNGVAARFSTTMTGEVFDVLSQYSIISQSLTPGESRDWDAYTEGLETSATGGGVLHHLFSVRTRHLLGGQHDGKGASFLSGILIGNELHGMLLAGKRPKNVCVVGSSQLTESYCRAFAFFNINSFVLDSDKATLAGHHQVARAAGIISSG